MKTYEDVARCRACGYPLRGLLAQKCPECGAPFDRQDPSTFSHPDTQHPAGLRVWLAYVGNGLLAGGGLCQGFAGAVADVSLSEQRLATIFGASVMAVAILNLIMVLCRQHSSSRLFYVSIGCTSVFAISLAGYFWYEKRRMLITSDSGIELLLLPVMVGLTLVALIRRARSGDA